MRDSAVGLGLVRGWAHEPAGWCDLALPAVNEASPTAPDVVASAAMSVVCSSRYGNGLICIRASIDSGQWERPFAMCAHSVRRGSALRSGLALRDVPLSGILWPSSRRSYLQASDYLKVTSSVACDTVREWGRSPLLLSARHELVSQFT